MASQVKTVEFIVVSLLDRFTGGVAVQLFSSPSSPIVNTPVASS